MADTRSKRRQLDVFADIDHLPVEYSKRTCTDVCCLITGLIFSLVMFILAFILFNYNHYFKVNFPADGDGVLCGIDQPAYSYVYFANPPNIARRVCVTQCPKNSNENLKCLPTNNTGCAFSNSPGFQVTYYPTDSVKTRSGNFCYPKDQKLRNELLKNSKLESRNSFYNSLDTIILSFFVALGFSIIYFLAVQFLPVKMNYISVVLGGIFILVTAIVLFLYHSDQKTLKIIAGVVLLLFLLLITFTVFKNTDSWRMHAIFLKYSARVVKQRKLTLLYIPIFFVILIAFVVILVLEFWAYWSSGSVSFDAKNNMFYKLSGNGPVFLSVLLIIQAIWGLTFIKTAFNFCVAGQATDWYYEAKNGFIYPLKLLVLKHLGSVIGGSFMIGVFSLPDLIFDLIKPDENSHPNGCYTKCYKAVFQPCILIFDLTRSDAMAYISLTGNPFCNSARYCQYLCGRSIIMDYSQSTSRTYRLCAHLLLMGIIGIFALFVKGQISIYALIVILIQTLFIATLFISIHADATEAIQILFLADEQFMRRKKEDDNLYDNTDIEGNLTGFRYRTELAEQVKQERIFEKNKREQKS